MKSIERITNWHKLLPYRVLPTQKASKVGESETTDSICRIGGMMKEPHTND